jgi:Flp pilus assembly pilin Flp
MKNPFSKNTERGATLVEYSLLLALLTLACFTGLTVIGLNIKDRVDYINARLSE